MSKAAHNIPPKRLSVEIRKTIALDAVANTISSAARQHQVTNKTAARHRNKALEAINQTFDKHNKKSDGHLFEIPVSKGYIKTIIVLLFIIVKASVRDIIAFVKHAFDYDISHGYISQVLDEATAKANQINQGYDLSPCKTSATDELFHQNKPTLAAIDIDSQFCMGLSSEEHRDEDTWGCFLLDLAQNGYHPEANVMDAGAVMTAAFNSILPEISIRYDHFHILKDIKEDLRLLKNKKESAMTEVIKVSTKIDKARKKNKHQKYSVKLNSAKKSLEHLESIYQTFKTLTEWLQYDVLQLQSINYQDKVKLFDFIVNELEALSVQHPQRIKALATKLANQKEKLLDAACTLNDKFKQIAMKHNIALETIWEICNLGRFNIHSDNYHIKALSLEALLGENYDTIEDEILLAIASVHRSSSLIENFNSRLRSYLDPRKGFKKSRYALIQFALNHLPFERSIHEKLVGHSPAEVFTQTDHIDFLSLLDLQRFKKAA